MLSSSCSFSSPPVVQSPDLLDAVPDDGVGRLLVDHAELLARKPGEDDASHLDRLLRLEEEFRLRARAASQAAKDARVSKRVLIIAGALVLLGQ